MGTGARRAARRVWIDIDNPPQVQYLAPFAEAFGRQGAEVLVTARDHGIAHDLLRERSLQFHSVGVHPGASKIVKAAAVLRRAIALARRVRPWKPHAAVFATRSAALVTPILRIPGFALVDYEFVDLRAFRVARTYIVHPSVLGDALREQGFAEHRLIPYGGIKEDITFADVDIDSVEPYHFAELDGSSKARLLVRPPDDRSHYHRETSSELTRAALEHLASRDDVVVILSPRYPEQIEFVQRFDWRTPPLVLDEAVPFQRLLVAVDAVLTGGGTMAREAAYLGVPSFSVYTGRLGSVDRFLETEGRLVVLRDAATLDQVQIERRPRTRPLKSNPRAVEQIVEAVSSVAFRNPS